MPTPFQSETTAVGSTSYTEIMRWDNVGVQKHVTVAVENAADGSALANFRIELLDSDYTPSDVEDDSSYFYAWVSDAQFTTSTAGIEYVSTLPGVLAAGSTSHLQFIVPPCQAFRLTCKSAGTSYLRCSGFISNIGSDFFFNIGGWTGSFRDQHGNILAVKDGRIISWAAYSSSSSSSKRSSSSSSKSSSSSSTGLIQIMVTQVEQISASNYLWTFDHAVNGHSTPTEDWYCKLNQEEDDYPASNATDDTSATTHVIVFDMVTAEHWSLVDGVAVVTAPSGYYFGSQSGSVYSE